MRHDSDKSRVTRELQSLFRSLDLIADHYLAKRSTQKEQRRFHEIYRQLGLAWEFLGLQCKHWDGYRKTREGHRVCKICGKVRGREELWLLLPKKGNKQIGRRVTPNSETIYPNKRKATLLEDGVTFHGAKLSLDVHNRYKSRLLKHKFTIAEERAVRLQERDVECVVYREMVCLRLPEARRKAFPKRYGAFPSELPKKTLKKFPVIFEYDNRDKLVGMTVFWSDPTRKRRQVRSKKRE